MITLDSETVGLYGMPVLLQYAQGDGEIKLYDIWKNPIGETLELLEWIASQEVCGFNLVFDWFQIAKCYTTFSLFPDHSVIPEDHINEIGILEEKARFSDFCIKPKAACDIMLHARKSKYQSLMQRNAIRVKRIPTLLAEAVHRELEKRIHLDGIYFAKRKDPDAPQWQIKDIDDDPEFKDIILKFHPSGQLKELAKHALGVKEDFILRFTDIQPNPHWRPVEIGYAPFALASAKVTIINDKKKIDWKGTWPEVIRHYISHWAHNNLARKYGCDDVVYTRDLWKHFGSPEPGDDDSELACAVAVSRWRGFAIDKEAILKLKAAAIIKKGKIPIAPAVTKIYLKEVMDETESMVLAEGTKAIILESIAGKEDDQGNWDYGEGWLTEDGEPHSAAIRARQVLEARRAGKEIELYDKLLRADRFHASLKVIGTLSSRMAGADDLNPQGIKKKKYVRKCFPLADFEKGFVLSGGDFENFEIIIAEAIYDDPKLRADLLAGKSIHGLFAAELFDTDYETIMATKKENTQYDDGKRGVYGRLYGGDENTLVNRLGIDIETATKASEGFMDRYSGIRRAREKITNKFCSMRQPGGLGTQVEWHDPAEFIESLLGFRRYFTLENKICKTLFGLANDPPKIWTDFKIRVRRRDRSQTGSGACQSALYAAAFQIQAAALRQAANHEIQSTGSQINKRVQRNIWNLQPFGVHPWVVHGINIHDEVHIVSRPEYVDKIAEVVNETVESFRDLIPLIKMDWHKKEKSWADK